MNRRQRVRIALTLISFCLFPAIFYYFSPALVVMGSAQGIVTGSLIVFGLLFLSALVAGRGFCGWVCGPGWLQDACFGISDRSARGRRADWIKYLIWAPWIVSIALGAIRAGGYHEVQFGYMTNHGMSLGDPPSYIAFFSVLALIVTLSLTAGRRAFCHYACWMAPFMVLGTGLRNLLRLPGLRLHSDGGQCSHCGRCDRECPMSLAVQAMVEKQRMTNTECILCGKCVDGCPRRAIAFTMRPEPPLRGE